MKNDIDIIWQRLCDELNIEDYYDNSLLYTKLCELIRSLNKSKYKDQKEKQWVNIGVE